MIFSYLNNMFKLSFTKRNYSLFLFNYGSNVFYYCNSRRKKYLKSTNPFIRIFRKPKFKKFKDKNLHGYRKKRNFIKFVRYSFFRNYFYSIFHKRFS